MSFTTKRFSNSLFDESYASAFCEKITYRDVDGSEGGQIQNRAENEDGEQRLLAYVSRSFAL